MPIPTDSDLWRAYREKEAVRQEINAQYTDWPMPGPTEPPGKYEASYDGPVLVPLLILGTIAALFIGFAQLIIKLELSEGRPATDYLRADLGTARISWDHRRWQDKDSDHPFTHAGADLYLLELEQRAWRSRWTATHKLHRLPVTLSELEVREWMARLPWVTMKDHVIVTWPEDFADDHRIEIGLELHDEDPVFSLIIDGEHYVSWNDDQDYLMAVWAGTLCKPLRPLSSAAASIGSIELDVCEESLATQPHRAGGPRRAAAIKG
ncbi:MAG: hypothetical protein AAGC60_07430 [Acidobacteriota bacterium]